MINLQDIHDQKALLSKDKNEKYAGRHILDIVKKRAKFLVNKKTANATCATIFLEDVKMY